VRRDPPCEEGFPRVRRDSPCEEERRYMRGYSPPSLLRRKGGTACGSRGKVSVTIVFLPVQRSSFFRLRFYNSLVFARFLAWNLQKCGISFMEGDKRIVGRRYVMLDKEIFSFIW